jgi:hypothetical protein
MVGDNRRQIEQHEARQREREKREAAEIEPPRSATGRLIASAGGRADNSLGWCPVCLRKMG